MRCFIMPLLAFFSMTSLVFSQEKENTQPAANRNTGSGQVYDIQVTEFRMRKASDIKMTPGQIIQSLDEMKENGGVEIIETMRFIVLDGHEAVLKQRKSTTVTTGTMSVPNVFPNRNAQQPGERPAPSPGPPGGVLKSMSQLNLGAIVRLTAEESSGKTMVKLSYEVSRLQEEPPEDRMPDMTEFSIDTTLRLDRGKTILVGGSSADSSNYLAISVK